MTRRSRPSCEVHNRWHSTVSNRELPSHDSPVSTLDEGASSHGSQDHWRNTLETKKEKIVRIVFQNIAGLYKELEACDMKLEILCQWVTHNQVDILGCIELGTCWDLVEYSQRLPQLTREWWEAVQWSVGYNWVEKHPSTVQPGGMCIAVFNRLTHHAQKAGNDPTGLGQWS